jgi:hypothetical protein
MDAPREGWGVRLFRYFSYVVEVYLMKSTRPIVGVQPRRSALLIGIVLCAMVALALVLLIFEPPLP